MKFKRDYLLYVISVALTTLILIYAQSSQVVSPLIVNNPTGQYHSISEIWIPPGSIIDWGGISFRNISNLSVLQYIVASQGICIGVDCITSWASVGGGNITPLPDIIKNKNYSYLLNYYYPSMFIFIDDLIKKGIVSADEVAAFINASESIDFWAYVLSNYVTADIAASIFNSSNMSIGRAVSVFSSLSFTADKAALILGSLKMNPQKGAQILTSLNSINSSKTADIVRYTWTYNTLTKYAFRIPITIKENSGNNLKDYQVNITIDTASLISSGKMKLDCGDIRFIYVYPNGTQIKIPYWIETSVTIALIPQGDDDSDVRTKDSACSINPSFRYYYCIHPCEPANWYKIDYDDSSWNIGVTPFGGSAYNLSCTNALNYAPDDLFIRREFYLLSLPMMGKLYLAYDDGIRCYLNEYLVIDDLRGSGAAYYYGVWTRVVDIPGNYFRLGKNVLACWVANGGENDGGGSGALDLKLEAIFPSCNLSNTRIWVKVPYIPANGTATIYMYYGNPNLLSESNIDTVFDAVGVDYTAGSGGFVEGFTWNTKVITFPYEAKTVMWRIHVGGYAYMYSYGKIKLKTTNRDNVIVDVSPIIYDLVEGYNYILASLYAPANGNPAFYTVTDLKIADGYFSTVVDCYASGDVGIDGSLTNCYSYGSIPTFKIWIRRYVSKEPSVTLGREEIIPISSYPP